MVLVNKLQVGVIVSLNIARIAVVTVAMGEQVLFEKGHKDNTFFVL